MENFNNLVNKVFHIYHNRKREGEKWYISSLFLSILFSVICGYSQPIIGQKPLGSTVEDVPIAQKEAANKNALIVYAPDDPALHKYLDSLNLYIAYRAQMKFNPPQDVNRSLRRDTLIMMMEILEKDARIRAVFFKKLPEKATTEDFAFYNDEDSFRKDCPMDALLIGFYKGLTFKEPTETGLWGTPELSHATIGPSSSYFGGVDVAHAALNPVYKEPTKEIRYAGDYKDVEKYRSAPKVKVLLYFDVIETINMDLGGGKSRYKWYPKNGPLRQISKELYPDCTPYNTRTLIPHY